MINFMDSYMYTVFGKCIFVTNLNSQTVDWLSTWRTQDFLHRLAFLSELNSIRGTWTFIYTIFQFISLNCNHFEVSFQGKARESNDKVLLLNYTEYVMGDSNTKFLLSICVCNNYDKTSDLTMLDTQTFTT